MAKGSVNGEGYRIVTRHGHPLAGTKGRVLEHRAVLFDAIGAGPHPCHWCRRKLDWGRICVDHLDDDRANNVLTNLVPSCRSCNAQRSDVVRRLGPSVLELLAQVKPADVQAVLAGLAAMLEGKLHRNSWLAAYELRHLAHFAEGVAPDCGRLVPMTD